MLAVRNVSKQFTSGRGKVAALQGISFTVETGSSLILAGRSGSGKTTLLNCLGTLEIPDQGEIVCDDKVVSRMDAKRRADFRRAALGFVFQDRNLLPWLTVAENLAFPLELTGLCRSTQNQRIAELLQTFGLSGYEKALPAELSGGESQRIAFARAIAHRPAMLLADEPTASLDSANGGTLMELMFSLCREQGTTLIIATHDRDLLRKADRVLFLKDGKMEEKNENVV